MFYLAAFSVVYTFTAELFPTSVRTIGLGIGAVGGGIGGVIAPYILSLKVTARWLPSVLFGISSFLAAFTLVFMPETKDQPLRQTVTDSVESWKKKEVVTVTDQLDNQGFQLEEK